MPLLHAVAAVNDGNDPSLESCSLMAALVAVNTLNDHDVSIHDSDQINHHVTQRVYITHSYDYLNQCTFAHGTNTTYYTGYRRYCNYGGWFGWPTLTFTQKIYIFNTQYTWISIIINGYA